MKDKINELKESMKEYKEIAQKVNEIGEELNISDESFYKWDCFDSEEIESNNSIESDDLKDIYETCWHCIDDDCRGCEYNIGDYDTEDEEIIRLENGIRKIMEQMIYNLENGIEVPIEKDERYWDLVRIDDKQKNKAYYVKDIEMQQ